MDDTRVDTIIESLKTFAKNGTKFYDAKESLIKEGYTDEEIEEASEQFSYDSFLPKVNNGQQPIVSEEDRDDEPPIENSELNMFNILPAHSLSKVSQPEINSLLGSYEKAAKKNNRYIYIFTPLLSILTAALIIWGLYVIYYSGVYLQETRALLFLIICIFMIVSGGDAMIFKVGHYYEMPYPPIFLGVWARIDLNGFGAVVYGFLAFSLGMLSYVLLFTPILTTYLLKLFRLPSS